LSSFERVTSAKPSGADPSRDAGAEGPAPLVAQPPAAPNNPNAPLAAIPFSMVRREITSPMFGWADGLTATPS
jgi:hypothetical protein